MKRLAVIVAICFLILSEEGKAQSITIDHDSLFHSHKENLFLDFNSMPLSFPQSTMAVFNHYQTPKLPFFCGMEDKFRNKFNIYFKLRAGTDEQYEKMIHTDSHDAMSH